MIVIIGGGLVGLSTALFLSDRGAEVTIVDHGTLGGGTARGNAGFMCKTLVGPLAGPGLIGTALRALTDPTGPVSVRPQAIPSLPRWLFHFAKASTARKHHSSRRSLARLNDNLDGLLKHLADAGVTVSLSPPLVVPFHDVAFGEKFLRDLHVMREFGVEVPDALSSGDEIRGLVPVLTDHVRAGFALPGDRSLDPRHFVDSLIRVLRERRVTFVENAPIGSIGHSGGRIKYLATARGRIDGGQFVIAAGAGSDQVARHVGLRAAVVAGQGYNVVLPPTPHLVRPVLIEEAHAVATPLSDRIRLGGTMEFTGPKPTFDGRRVDAIVNAMQKFLHLEWDKRSGAWSGSRPMSPDGMPLIGRPRQWSNLVFATGHGMYGLTLAPSTGLAVSQLLLDGKSGVDLSPFDPDRF